MNNKLIFYKVCFNLFLCDFIIKFDISVGKNLIACVFTKEKDFIYGICFNTLAFSYVLGAITVWFKILENTHTSKVRETHIFNAISFWIIFTNIFLLFLNFLNCYFMNVFVLSAWIYVQHKSDWQLQRPVKVLGILELLN